MELTPSRKAKLIIFKILEYAEIGGMEQEDCGIVYESITNCLCDRDEPEDAMDDLNKQIQQILNCDHLTEEPESDPKASRMNS